MITPQVFYIETPAGYFFIINKPSGLPKIVNFPLSIVNSLLRRSR